MTMDHGSTLLPSLLLFIVIVVSEDSVTILLLKLVSRGWHELIEFVLFVAQLDVQALWSLRTTAKSKSESRLVTS